MARASSDLSTVAWSTTLAGRLERAARAIGTLDARVSTTSVGSAWELRAAWAGFAQALQLQGVEIDEIDLFSWGCGLPLPSRPRRSTTVDEFASYAGWTGRFRDNGRHHWTDGLPFTPASVSDDPPPLLLRTFELTRCHTLADRSIAAWLDLPLILQRIGFTRSVLPCLVIGDKRLRLGGAPPELIAARLLDAAAEASDKGLDRLLALEQHRARSVAAIAQERRPGALTRLLALAQLRPLLSPQSAAHALGLTLSGAGKLLARAAALELLAEVSGRRAWRVYLVPDVAVELGLKPPRRGRPTSRLPTPDPAGPLSHVIAAFDLEMAAFEARYGAALTIDQEKT